ncbi:YceI family protein [Methylocella silvestris]|uniref:Polyisoprenoid-binding protein n=1 Tax=Methylocella silvestris TaxID=199596 RepID=A0A2J7TKZ4_METSI|nr:YceI family protein [Methylocella silvestris]PNG27433.1 polyisoprenoid-binding protein [Methylocella silvestris]
MLNKIPSKAALLAALLAAPFLSAPAKAQTAPAAVEAGSYAVDPTHTRVLFKVSHMGFTNWYGEFTDVTGQLTLDPKAPEKSAVAIHIPAKTISTTNAKLNGELKADDWFDVAKYPDIAFKSTKLVVTGAGSGQLTGDLTFHGVTKPVTLAVTYNAAGPNPLNKKYTVGFDATGSIKRSDFGVTKYVPLIGDEVGLIISAGFERKE